MKFLADRGADPNARDYSHPDGLNRTCLHTAALHGLVAHLTHLLSSSKADAESTDSRQRTPLMTAVVSGHIECVRALLAASLKSIDRRDIEGHTALSLAAFAGRVDIADELLKSGAQIYASARNPIKLAHHSGNNELVCYIKATLINSLSLLILGYILGEPFTILVYTMLPTRLPTVSTAATDATINAA